MKKKNTAGLFIYTRVIQYALVLTLALTHALTLMLVMLSTNGNVFLI